MDCQDRMDCQTTIPHLSPVLVLCAAVWLVLAGCRDDTVDEAADDPTPAEQLAANVLSDAERTEGWRLLFDGETLDGWHAYGRDSIATWTVEDGTITTRPDSYGDIVTDEAFADFEFVAEWKIEAGGNSGIIYRVVDDPERYGATYLTGPEYQLLDDPAYEGQLSPAQLTASNYDVDPPSTNATRPAGSWNETRIVVDGDHVEHWLNGEKVVEYELGSPAWEERVAVSKWSEEEDYGRAEEGHIAIQNHDSRVWLRNVKVRPLGSE